MSNMTKRLPHIQNYRPYKYQEVRRKFRTEIKGKKDIARIDEEEYRPKPSREPTNLAVSNLGVSRENLGASQDSLNKDEVQKIRNPLHDSHESLRASIAQRQTSLENLKRREENGKHVYSFSLSKADRSYSEPVLFPPVAERKAKASQPHGQGHTNTGQNIKGAIKGPQTPHIYTPLTTMARENTLNSMASKDKRQFPVKFPIVSRSDLYKHLGIMPDGRKKKRLDENKVNRDSNHGFPKHILQMMPDSGGSRQVATSSHHMYGKDAEPMPKNKVEMYKQWHEEQGKKHRSKRPTLQSEVTKDAVRLASIYREKYNASDARAKQQSRQREGTLPKIGVRNAPSRITVENNNSVSQQPPLTKSTGPRPESPPAQVPDELKNRVYSAKTWKTWRDINTSYSYVDVKEYIEDNELMDEEKEDWITDWIIDVDRKFFHPPLEDSDDEEDAGRDCNSQSGKMTQTTNKSDKTTHSENYVAENTELVTKAEAVTKL